MKYRYLTFISMLYILLDIFPSVLWYKPILMPIGFISARILIGAAWCSLCDIIAEVYGMKVSIRLFWLSATCRLLFSFFCFGLIKLPSFFDWTQQHSYDYLLGSLTYDNFFEIIAIVIAWYINIYFLTKWKVLTEGKYFLLRSIGSSLVGLTAFMIIMSIIQYFCGMLLLHPNFTETAIRAIWSLMISAIVITLYAIPSSFIITLLKIIEKNIDEKNRQQSFNPFRSH